MEKLIISTGLKRYEVNDSGAIFSFNPNDANLFARFLRMREKIGQIGDALNKARESLDLDKPEDLEKSAFVLEDADKQCKQALTECFGNSNDFDAIFDGTNAFSLTDTGECVVTNFITAITPVIEKETQAYAKAKAKRQAAKAKQKKAKRAKK